MLLSSIAYPALSCHAQAIGAPEIDGAVLAQEGGAPGAQDAASVSTEGQIAAASQETPATGEDIVVTALKRSASVQNVPVTVSVVSGETISKANITSALDLPAITPGVLIQVAPGALPVAAIRGIGSNASNQSFDQSVALFVDGVFAARGRDYVSSLFDIADIQVIKGGQSAVLGKNTTIGALVLSTRRPGDELGYEASFSHEFALGSDTFDAAVNVPLGETLAVRAAGRYADLEGWTHNDLTGQDSPTTETLAGRLSLRWRPTSTLDWNLSFQAERYRGRGQALYVAGDSRGLVAALAAQSGDPRFTAAFNDHYRSSARAGFPDDFNNNDMRRAISTLSYDFGDGFNLTSTSAYLHSKGSALSNFDAFSNAPIYFKSDRAGAKTFSQELRLSTPRIAGIFEAIVGGLYYHDKYGYNSAWDGIAPITLTGDENTIFDQTTRDWSGFASLAAHLSERITINAAARFTTENRSADYSRIISRAGPLTTAIFRPFAPTTLSRSTDNLDGSASIQYRPNSDVMIYTSYAKGTKSGGFANNPNDPSARRSDGTRAAEFGDEVAYTFELGAKIGKASGSYLNFAFFNIDVDDFQTSLFSGVIFIVKNIDIRSRGIELSGAWQANDAFRLSLDVTYADAINKNPTAVEIRRLIRAPLWSGIGRINYASSLENGWRLTADATAEFRSRLFFQDNPASTVPPSPGFAKIGLRVGVQDPGSGIEVALVGRNLTDRRIANYGTGLFPGVAGAYLASSEPPRTVALQFSIKR